MAASATFALKSGEWFRRVRFVIFAPDSHAQPCALSGRDSTHRTDRNYGATSHYPKIAPPDSGGAAETVVLFERRHAGQKLTKSLMAASAFDGTTLRATKSSQFLNLPLTRASTMALARAGPICGSVSSSVAVAVLRLILLTTGAGVVGFAGFAGVVTAGAAGFDGCGV